MSQCVETPMAQSQFSINSLATPEPHYIPGYAGHLPQAKFRPGNTYGMTSHRVLLDPCIHMSPRSILNNVHPEYCTDDFGRPGIGADPLLNAQMALVNSRVNSFGRQQYQAEMTPGYTGFIPRFQTILGHTYSPACNRALARFEQDQWRDRLFNKELEALDGWRFCYKSKPWETPETQRTGFGDLQEFARSPSCQQPKFLRNDVQCSTRAGTCGCGGSGEEDDFGRGATGSYGPAPSRQMGSPGGCGCERTVEFTLLTKERPSCDYGNRRLWGIGTDQILQPTVGDIVPRLNAFRISRPPVDRIQEIFRGCEGLMPSYTGHVPGEQFRIGRNFTCSTRNAKRAIEPVYHKPLCYPPNFRL